MLGVRPTARFSVHGRSTASPDDAGPASLGSAEDIFEFIDLELASIAPTEIRSANIEDTMREDVDSGLPFNYYIPGSDDWYAHGVQTGVWVAGRSIDAVVNASDDRFSRIWGVMHRAAGQLQQLNDRFARLHAEGIGRHDLQLIARRTLPPIADEDYELDTNEGSTGHDDFVRLYHGIRELADNDLASNIVERSDWGTSGSRVDTWGQDTLGSLESTLDSIDADIKDGDGRRSEFFEDAMQRRREIAAAMRHLPFEVQRAAWDYFIEALEAGLDASEEDLPMVIQSDWETQDAPSASQTRSNPSSKPGAATVAAALQVELARQQLALDLGTGLLQENHEQLERVIGNLVA